MGTANPNPVGFVTKGAGYIAFVHIACVRRDGYAMRTIISLQARDVAMQMEKEEHAAFVAALAFWASGA